MELQIVEFLNHWGSGWIDPVTVFISKELFLIILWTLITFIILFSDKRKGKRVLIAVSIVIFAFFCQRRSDKKLFG